MTDYQIEANSCRCAATGRELHPGERVYTVLLDEGGKFVRRDFSTEAWQGPPANAFSFWAGRVPARGEQRRLPIDDDLLLQCFRRLEGETQPDRINFRYVVALLLMRRKRLKFEEARVEGGQEVLCLRCPRLRELHQVLNPGLSDEQMAQVQEEVSKVLGWQ
jgi:hypothetical protein